MIPDPYQIIGSDFLIDAKRAILGDDMGLGKTAQALLALDKLNAKNILVICPKNIRQGWVRETTKWLGSKGVKTNIITTNAASRICPDLINIVHYDIIFKPQVFRQLKQGGPYDVIICDEAHKLKNHAAKRTLAVLDPRTGIAANTPYLWLLTGTPVLNRPEELFPLLRAVDKNVLGVYNSFFKFAKRFCNARLTEWGWDFSGSSNLPELAQMLKPILLRRTAAELGLNLGQPRQQLIILEKPETISEEEIEREKNAYRDPKNMMLGDLASLRSKLALEKVGQVSSFAKDTLETVDKIVIFAHHINVINVLADDLKDFNPAIVNGQTKDKQSEIDKFIKDPKCRVYLGNYAASAEGIDGLQAVCSTMITAELIWTPKIIEQAIGRLARRGQKNLVNVFHCILENSADEDYILTLLNKEKVSNEILLENDTQFKKLAQTRTTTQTIKREKNMFTFDEQKFKILIKDCVKECLVEMSKGTPAPTAKKTAPKPVAIEAPAAPAAVDPIAPPVPATPAAPIVVPFDLKRFADGFNTALSNIRKTNAADALTFAAECRKYIKENTGADSLSGIIDSAIQKTTAEKIAEMYNAKFGTAFGCIAA